MVREVTVLARIFSVETKAKGALPHTSSHELRHHYASVLLDAGESVVTVAARLGHKDANMVITTYGHLMPNSEDRTRKAVDDAWSAPSAPQTGRANA
jgi:integrase